MSGCRCAGEFAVKRTRGRCSAAPFAKSGDLDDAHRAVERDRHDITEPDRLTGCEHAFAVEAYVTGVDQRGGVASRAYHARVPEPFIDALAAGIQT